MNLPPKRQPIPFGKYLLLDRINIGGMAEVWRGKQFGAGGFERLAAIKRILPNIAEDEEFIMMFLDEAKITVQLTHANIAQVYELNRIGSSYYIAMEYVPGKDLRAIFDRCRKKGEPAPIPLTCFVIGKLCDGLDYAHRKKDALARDMNIVHRDVSPQNVLVSYEGEVKVIDFGIAKAAGKASKTQAGILKGKFAYMSPEQIRGIELDGRSDIFGIGICLYEMLTGERLFVGDSDFSVLEKVRKAEVVPPSTYNRRIPEALERIVLKALARETEDRYQYASDLADDLQKFLITSDTIFSRKDLMQYMKSTFAEEVEREKTRLHEYADVKPSEGMLAAIESGAVAPAPVAAAPLPLLPALPRPPNGGAPLLTPPGPVGAVAANGAVRRVPSIAALPRLTAAAPMVPDRANESTGATQLVDGATDGSSSPGGFDGSEAGPTVTGGLASVHDAEPIAGAEGAAAPAAEPASDSSDTVLSLNVPEDLRGVSLAMVPAAKASSGGFIAEPEPEPALEPSLVSAPTAASAGNGAYGNGHLEEDPGATISVRPLLPSPAANVVATPASAPRRNSRPQADASPPLDDEQMLLTTSPNQGALRREPHSQPRGRPLGTRPSPNTLVASILVAVLLVAVGVGFILFKRNARGMLYIELPKELAAGARVNVNGEDYPVREGTWAEKVPTGPATVIITADGWNTFTGSVDVKRHPNVTPLHPEMTRKQQTAELFVVVEGSDADGAEVRVDGEAVKAPADKGRPFEAAVAVGKKVRVEVVRAGHVSHVQEVLADDARRPVIVTARLLPDTFAVAVRSNPPGARIVVGGKQLGETPATVNVPSDARTLVLKKRCHDDRVVSLKRSAKGADRAVEVSGDLKRQRGCR